MRMGTFISQQYLTIVYDLGRGRVVWVGRDRSETTMERFFAWLGRRRARAIYTVCCDMWSVDIDAVQAHLPQAALVLTAST
jgi:transposase